MLHTLTYELELSPNKTIQFNLPKTIKPGRHQIVLIIDEKTENTDAFQSLLDTTKGLWQQGDGLMYQEKLRSEWE